MPATAAIDNETLDHLLSVVDEGNQYNAGRAIRKGFLSCQIVSSARRTERLQHILRGQRMARSAGQLT
jgi:hypothetical protein